MLRNRRWHKTLGFSKIKFWVFVGLLSIGLVQCVNPSRVMTLSKPTVTFELSNSSISEDVSTASLAVNLNAVSSEAIAVDYVVTGGTASQTNRGSGQDYTLAQGTLTFEPGTVTKNLSISIVDDDINEADENIEIKLLNPKNAILDAKNLHSLEILDNDRQSIVSARDFGATGDGITDDTKAIQAAIDTVYNQGGGVILFPPGVYIVTSVKLKENITYQGYEATIKRPENQDKWTRTFTTEYSGKENSKPLIIKGLTFDGNSKNQGAYQKYELEQAHLIFLTAERKLPGRLQAFIEDCTFKNGVSDGISVYTNVSVKVDNCEAIDVFRGGFVLTGGNSSAEVYNLTTRGKVDPTGIDIEVDGRGYGDTLKVDVKLENLNLIDGDFDVNVEDGSTVIGNNIISGDAPFYIFSLNSTMKFSNSKFKIGAADDYDNRILFPHDVTFDNCEFYVTRKETGKPYSFFSAAYVWWQHPSYSKQRNQLLVFNNCLFKVDSNMKETDKTYAVYLRKDEESSNNRLIINGGDISKKFKIPVFKEE
ncbi:Calx-beta domain-containing protein [Scytonema sp. PCC 10023]|uniref:Calx-beta domain-containing protein n=1 Tax=Scytonema sp. PCC 10023 TaxID=1680591 RepID=UPI0039C60F3C